MSHLLVHAASVAESTVQSVPWAHVICVNKLPALSAAQMSSFHWYAATLELHVLQVFTSVQDAMGLVHMYPFLPDAMEYMDCIANLQGLPEAAQEPVTQADWDALLAYCAKVTAADHFHYVPLLHTTRHAGQAAPAAASTPNHSVVAAHQTPSPVQRCVHFSPDSVLRQPPFSSSQSPSHSGSHTLQQMQPPAYSPTTPHRPWLHSEGSQALPSLGESQMVQSLELSRQVSRQGSSQLNHTHAQEVATSWVPQPLQASQHAPLSARQDQSPGHLPSYSQHQMPGPLQAADQFPDQGLAFHGQSYGSSHTTAAPFPMTPNSFRQVQLQPGQFVQVEAGQQVFVSQAPVQSMYSSPPVQGHASQGTILEGHVVQGRQPDHLPAWLGQNLAYTHANAVGQSAPNRQMHSPTQMQAGPHLIPAPNPKAVYPTAAMRSQQLTQQTQHAHSAGSVKAPLAPFLNEQLKRMLAEGGPSGRRGF